MTNTVTVTEQNNTVSILEDAPVVTPDPWYQNLKTIPTSSGSATVTADSTPNTKGAWTEIIASNGATTSALYVEVSNVYQQSTNTGTLIDIGVGASGSETAIAENIAVGAAGPTTVGINFVLPIKIEAGARIAVRSQAVIASDTAFVDIDSLVLGDPSLLPTTVDVLGTSTTTSAGTTLATTYREVVASTSQEYLAIVIVESSTVTGQSTFTFPLYVGTGASGSETDIAQKLITTSTSEFIASADQPFLTTQSTVAAGTRIAAKYTTNFDNRVDVTVIGVPAA